jgi:hypothetical protein
VVEYYLSSFSKGTVLALILTCQTEIHYTAVGYGGYGGRYVPVSAFIRLGRMTYCLKPGFGPFFVHVILSASPIHLI